SLETFLLDIGTHWFLKALTRPTPRCYNIADFLDDNNRQNHLRALARAFASALWARARARPRRTIIQHRAPTRPER
ncbi:hypothetical protein, partial [Halobellus captivus]|uniref:hypothetical protein n=1 Tax=Halobellus captivus TaxID=2592614 RepID=UPI00193A9FEB